MRSDSAAARAWLKRRVLADTAGVVGAIAAAGSGLASTAGALLAFPLFTFTISFLLGSMLVPNASRTLVPTSLGLLAVVA